MIHESETPTPWATICRGDPEIGFTGCGQVFMTEDFYIRQMSLPDSTWRCARCGYEAAWDDDNYEQALDEGQEMAETWLQEAHDYADARLNLGVQQCNRMMEVAEEVRAWEGDLEPMDWVDEWARNRHPEP